MDSGLLLAIFLTAFSANMLLGLLVVLRDPRSATMRLFSLFVAAMNIWALFNFLSARGNNLLVTRLVLFFAVTFAYLFFLFAHTFPGRRVRFGRRALALFGVWVTAVMVIALSPLAFKSIEVPPGGGLGQPVVGPGIGLFGLTVLFFDGGGLFILARKYLHAMADEKKQRLDLLIGLGSMKITIIALGFIFPTVLKNTFFIPYASAFMFPFVVFTSYAIVRHHFLDIRLVVARSVGYILSLGMVVFIFSLLIFGVSDALAANHVSIRVTEVFNLSVTIALVLLYPPLKRFFDRLTNKFFYRDAYDAQVFLNNLNRVLVSSIDLDLILSKTTRVLEANLKPVYARFEVRDRAPGGPRNHDLIEKGEKSDHFSVIEHLPEGLKQRRVIVADDLPESEAAFRKELSRNEIAVILRLIGSSRKDDTAAYLVLGPKKSGNIYNKQDIRVLEIIGNELVIAMQNALRFEEISRFNVTLRQKIEEATKELRAANKRLRALDEAKDEFISMASHQLRTPLTSVKGYLSMALDGDAGKLKIEQQELLQHAFDSAQRMVYLISDLLNVSRLQTGKFVIENKPTNLAEVIIGEMDQLKEQAVGRQITMNYDKPDRFPVLNLDETKIRQVIMNFLDNALYYTPKGGTVTVTLTANSQAVDFTVTDTGIGVPKSVQHQLFSKFYRADNARKARPDGTGLGLFMAKKVVVAQGGAIIFKSTEGKGSTFGFSLPRKSLEVRSS